MKKMAKRTLVRTFKALVYGLVGATLMLIAVGIYALNQKPDLKIWHTAELDEEFTATSPVSTFEEYLELEERLFRQLDEKVFAHIEEADQQVINRFHLGSRTDPHRWPTNWNRSFELPAVPGAGPARAGVLLLHGMSDAPYSLRALGERMHAEGAHVLGLRIPGHGTAPSGLTTVTWQDMSAAVELAMVHLRKQTGSAPLYIVGYSNGGALAVHYTLSTLENSALPAPDRLVLLSPEIGVSRMAALAIWQERIGRVTGLDKLSWTDVLPEWEPFKYGSFAVNAGNLVHQLTGVNRAKIARLSANGHLDAFPPVLAFQSAVDATVSAPALVRDLFALLPEGGHELVVFDLNREKKIEALLKKDPAEEFATIRNMPNRQFRFSLVTNQSAKSRQVEVQHWPSGAATPLVSALNLEWPADVYSMSHVALPFPGSDPVYGGDQPGPSPGINLGTLAFRGEKGVLQVPASDMLRLRWNPFYSYLEHRALEHLQLAPAPAASPPEQSRPGGEDHTE